LLKGLGLLEMKKTPIEKYQYLSVLRNTNVHLFYRLLSNNIKVCSRQKPDCQEVRSDKITTGAYASHLHSHCRRSLPEMVGDLHSARR
jgi:hypothetical protein